MLQNLEIQNYRLFQNLKIEDFSRVNLIVGKNNVGKSTLLEAISLLVAQYQQNELWQSFLKIADERGERTDRRIYQLRHFFSNHEFTAANPICLHSTNGQNLSLKILPRPENNRIDIESSLAETFQIDGINQIGDYQEKMSRVYPPAGHRISSHFVMVNGLEPGDMRYLWDQIQLRSKQGDVERLLRILEPQLEHVSFLAADSGIIVKMRGQEEPIPLGSLGDGMKRILGIAIALVSSADGYFLIDEIDTGLHYRTITDMWQLVIEAAKRLNVQIFATTHSLDCIRSFAEAIALHENKDVGAIFRLQRRGDDIQAVRYDGERLILAVEQDIEVR